jgi:hypothetical protein
VTRATRFVEGRWQAQSLTLRLENGLPFSAELDPSTGRLIRELDGTRSLRDALTAALDGEAVAEEGAAVARRMLEVGFIEFDD